MRERDDRRQQKDDRSRRFSSGGSTRLPSSPPTSARQVDPFDDQRQLRRLDRLRREPPVRRKRRAKAADLETLRPHRKAVAVPINQTHAVAALREKDEQVPAQ